MAPGRLVQSTDFCPAASPPLDLQQHPGQLFLPRLPDLLLQLLQCLVQVSSMNFASTFWSHWRIIIGLVWHCTDDDFYVVYRITISIGTVFIFHKKTYKIMKVRDTCIVLIPKRKRIPTGEFKTYLIIQMLKEISPYNTSLNKRTQKPRIHREKPSDAKDHQLYVR